MSGERKPGNEEAAARTARIAAEMLLRGGADLGDLSGLSPDQILERLNDGAAVVADAEQTITELPE